MAHGTGDFCFDHMGCKLPMYQLLYEYIITIAHFINIKLQNAYETKLFKPKVVGLNLTQSNMTQARKLPAHVLYIIQTY